MDLDIVILGATLPLPFAGSKYDFKTGEVAVRQGWSLIGYDVELAALVKHNPQSDAGGASALVTNRIQSSAVACVEAQKLLDRIKTRLLPDAFAEVVERRKAL